MITRIGLEVWVCGWIDLLQCLSRLRTASYRRSEWKGRNPLAVARRVSQSHMNRRSTSQPANGGLSAAIGDRLKSATIRTGILCAIFCFSFGAWGQTTATLNENAGPQGKSQESAPNDIGLPEKLRHLVAPGPSAPWHAPDLSSYTNAPKSAELSPIDPQKHYELVELIDLAQRKNPETRVAWESAVRAAIGVGMVQAEYYPVITLAATEVT